LLLVGVLFLVVLVVLLWVLVVVFMSLGGLGVLA
jgi:hypothetical protein